jgi:hypothetical protein
MSQYLTPAIPGVAVPGFIPGYVFAVAGSSTSPAVLTAATAFPAVSVSTSCTASPSVLAGSGAFPAVTVTSSAAITSSTLTAATAFPAVTATGNASAVVTPSALTLSTSLPLPLVGTRMQGKALASVAQRYLATTGVSNKAAATAGVS